MAKIISLVTGLVHTSVGSKFNSKVVSSIEYVVCEHTGLGMTAAKSVARDYWRICTQDDGKEREIGRIYAIEAYASYGE